MRRDYLANGKRSRPSSEIAVRDEFSSMTPLTGLRIVDKRAYSLGFHVAIVEDAVFDRSLLNHEVNLFDLHHKYADVMSLRALSRALSQPVSDDTVANGASAPNVTRTLPSKERTNSL